MRLQRNDRTMLMVQELYLTLKDKNIRNCTLIFFLKKTFTHAERRPTGPSIQSPPFLK